jgi:ribonuclease BN (tRNA processing enzyme)
VPSLPSSVGPSLAHQTGLESNAAYVLDCGVGVIDQYARTGIPFPALRSIFITHHHADHNIEYGPLLVIGWINGMHLDVRAFGPPPLKLAPNP